MGTSIQFDRLAVQFENENEFGREETRYLLVHQTGSDNMLNHDGTIARHWSYYCVGSQVDVITEIARAAGDIERGMIRYQNGSTKPENYIKNWREELRDDTAVTIDEFVEKFPFAELVVTQPSSVTDLPDRVRDAFSTIEDDWRRTTPDGRDRPVYHADVTENTLRLFETLADETHITVEFD